MVRFCVGVLLAALAVAACAQTPDPTPSTSLSPASAAPSPVPTPSVVDPLDLITAYEFTFNAIEPAGFGGIVPSQGAVVESPLEQWDIRVGWTALPCQTAPILQFAGGPDAPGVTIVRGPVVSADGGCEAMQATHYADVNLRSGPLPSMSVRVSDE